MKPGWKFCTKVWNLTFLIIFLFGVFSVFFLLGVVIDFIILICAFFESFHFSIFSKIFFVNFFFESFLSANQNVRNVKIQITGFGRVYMNHHWWLLCKVTLKLTLMTHSYGWLIMTHHFITHCNFHPSYVRLQNNKKRSGLTIKYSQTP